MYYIRKAHQEAIKADIIEVLTSKLECWLDKEIVTHLVVEVRKILDEIPICRVSPHLE